MKTRILWALVLIAVLFAALFIGGIAFCIFAAAVSVCTVYEMSSVFAKKGIQPWLLPAYVFMALYPFLYFYSGIRSVIALYTLALFATVIQSLFSNPIDAGRVMYAFAVFIYPVLFVCCACMVYLCFPEPYGITAALLSYGCANCADAAALFGGMRFGKRKLCPAISPKKTVAGSVSAFFGGAVFSVVLYFAQRIWGTDVPLLPMLCAGVLAGATSQIGDLFASTVKRWGEIKDFSKLIPEHGGIMDRIDSSIATAPMVLGVFALLQYFGIVPWK